MKIFVIGGKSGSGKNEVAKMVNEFYIYKLKKCVTTEFSKYIKLFAKELTDWDGISQNKPRRFLQEFGAKVRSYDERFLTWYNLFLNAKEQGVKTLVGGEGADELWYGYYPMSWGWI